MAIQKAQPIILFTKTILLNAHLSICLQPKLLAGEFI